MAAFWELHPWLIIILAVLAVPLVQALFEPVAALSSPTASGATPSRR